MIANDLHELATRHGFSDSAASEALRALRSGSGMAQFSHPELGGAGQWMPGMIMIGDMFNRDLRAKVVALFEDLARQESHRASSPSPSPADPARTQAFENESVRRPWPEEFGAPASVGGQNDMRYAYFPDARRLVVEVEGRRTVYDTGDHVIAGVSQQQSGRHRTTVFTSGSGVVPLETLPVVEPGR